MAKTSGSWSGPTTVTEPNGNFQHHDWINKNGLAMFKTYSWVGDDGGLQVVPQNQRLPGGNDGFVDGYTYIGPGSAGPTTVFTYSTATSSFTDTGKSASPLVEFNSDGSVKTAGYNPANGQWINADGSVGIPPANQQSVKGMLVQIRDLANAALK